MKKTKLLLTCLLFVFYGSTLKSYSQTVKTIVGPIPSAYTGSGGAIALDKNCNLYFVDNWIWEIRKMDAKTGAISILATSIITQDLEMDANDNLYAKANGSAVVKIDITTGAVTTIKTLTYGSSNIAVDGAGYIYVCENHQVLKIDPNPPYTSTVVAGNGTTGYSGDNGPATSASIDKISDIAVDPAGNLFLYQSSHNVIRKVNTSGIITTYAGTGVSGYSGDNGPATGAQLSGGNFLAIDPNGDLLLSDVGNFRIRKINASTGVITTIAGTGSSGYGGDGGPLSAATIAIAEDVAFDNAGNLFFFDGFDIYHPTNPREHRIRMACMSSPVSSVSISASPGNVVCKNTAVTFNATANSSLCYLNYKWYKDKAGNISHVGNGPTYTDYWPETGDEVYCEVTASSGPVAAFCSGITSSLTSNRITMLVEGFDITGIDINTRCAPGYSTPDVPTKFEISIKGGTSPVTYNWVPQGLNSTTLGSTTVSNPVITDATGDLIADYMVEIQDASGCPAQFLHVYTVLTIENTFDLALKDSPWDLYMEPNNQAEIDPNHWNIWLSPDVWNRIYADGNTEHEDAKRNNAGDPNYAYVNLRNVGCIAAPSSEIYRYWTMGGMPEIWPEDWTTSIFPGPNGNKPQGKNIGMYLNSNMHVGTWKLPPYSWVPPNPGDYFSGSTRMDICFLTRIEDDHNTNDAAGMTYTEVPRVSDNVRKNNNIATRNFKVVKVDHFKPGHGGVIVGGADNTTTMVSLDFVNEANFRPGATSYLNQYVTITVYLGDLFDIWVNGGAQGTYAGINYTDKSVTFDGTNTMRLDNIELEGTVPYPVEIMFEALNDVDIIQVPEEMVHFRQLYTDPNGQEEVYGNFTYQIKYNRDENEDGSSQQAAQPAKNGAFAQTGDVATYPGATSSAIDIVVYPNPTNSELNFDLKKACFSTIRILDLNGRILQEKQSNNRIVTLRMDDYPSGIYIYQITTEGTNKTGKVVLDRTE